LDVVRGEEAKRLGAARSRLRRAEYRQRPTQPQVRFGEYDQPVRIVSIVAGIALILGGLVWIAQGLNLPFAPRSFMTADRNWIVIGAATVLVGGILVWLGRRRTATG
jgi:hypothetical protein